MTKIFKRTFAGLTSMALLFSWTAIVPEGNNRLISGITAEAAETKVPNLIYVGDTYVKSGSVQDFSIPGVSYDDAGKLSLNNVSITTYSTGRTCQGMYFISNTDGSINVELTGNNFIGNNSDMIAGITADNTNVTFTGTGSLEINANSWALNAYKSSESFTFKPDADYEMTIYAADNYGEYTEIGTATANIPFTLNGNDDTYFNYGNFNYPWLKAVSSCTKVLGNGATGDCTWTMFGNGVLSVSGDGAMADYTVSSEVPWNSCISEIKSVTIDNGVTHIGDNSFSGCTSLESVDIKSASLILGNNIFADCPNLTAIYVPCNSTTDFSNNPDAVEKVVKQDHSYVGNICTTCGDYTSPVNMPVVGTSTIALTESNSSVTIYDDGGADGTYSSYCNGNLILKAPEGCLIQITGSLNSGSSFDYLNIYDGSDSSAQKLVDNQSGNINIDTVSSGSEIMINFYSDGSRQYEGFCLEAKILYNVDFICCGTLIDTKTVAAGETVTLPTAEMILGDNYDSSKDNTVTYTYGENQVFTEDTVISENMTVNCAIEGISAVTLTNGDITLTEFAYNDVPYTLPTAEKLLGKKYYPNVFDYTVNYTDISGNPITENSVTISENTVINFSITSDSKMKGTGTEDEPYIIETADGLCYFRDMINIGNNSICGKLTADIDLSGVCGKDIGSWVPIGDYDYQYEGTFNGNGHTISGLYIANAELAGLFGVILSNNDDEGNVISVGTVSDLGITDSFISGSFFVGGVCGYNYGGTIKNCYNTGSVNAAGNNTHAGGVCGLNVGEITNCYNTGSVNAAGNNTHAGGVCGLNVGEITNCYNTGSVNAAGNITPTGGVCGYNSGGTITNCYYLYSTAKIGIGNTESDTEGQAESKSVGQFKSGEVAYLLSQGCTVGDTTYNGSVWGQDLSVENSYPVLGGKKVLANSDQSDFANDIIIYGQNATLDGTIGFNIYVSADDSYEWDKTIGGVTGVKNEEGLYVFTYNVAAKDMDKMIQFAVDDKIDVTVSVSDYLADLSKTDNESLKNLADSMSVYGDAAKAYFSGETVAEETVTDDLSVYDFTVGTMPEGISYYGSSLILESETTVRHYFTIAEGKNIADFTFKVNNSAVTPTEKQGYYYIDMKNISAEKLGNAYTVSINGEDIITGYSALSYAKAVLESENTDANLKNFVKALYIYNQNACAYNNPNADAA